ncbi:hypothetical protein W97_03967 [Coniosporium apollinis CBS 100218]|uniref:GH16 domain-containing protein n=1 Tax=Coniosporium apollinis (strain CBS 100218) TaxID=1168221 RepID=R7YSE1_CONA1|nr:uncharacterized protein W97_03967 [Coniosporium apollinis CBS 100218]EON64734.1 hypothetical protein W97_03967 [Coniosporium apollinis CBS 100218]
MSSPPSSPPPGRSGATPHIRLNSGSDNILANDPAERPQTSRQPSSRSLIPQRPGTAPSLRREKSQNSLYHQPGHVAESAELLIPPKKIKTRRFRDDDSPMRSPSGFSSRRTSWSSESAGSRDSRMGPFVSPFDDSRAPSRAGSDDEGVNTQTVSEKYNILPSAGLLLFPEDVEKDDWLHNPDPNEKEKRECDIFTKRGLVNIGGLAFITLGILVLFIGYPILTFVQKIVDPVGKSCSSNPNCIDVGPISHFKNIRSGLIDPDTPDSVKSRKTFKGKKQVLVFSDEFNTDGRTFYDGDDTYWQGVDIWYGATQDVEWYDPDALVTRDGVLNIKFDAFQNHGLNYRSGMLQSWNKMCFKGGHVEASISLPGRGDTTGFWPGFWTMGNLGRPGYLATTDGMWPYSYHHECDAGITKNQSSTDGLSYLPGMRLPACTCKGQDHPSAGKSRSAPEIDALEATVDFLDPPDKAAIGVVSQSCQIAPFDMWYQPDYDYFELYDNRVTHINTYAGGPFQQAISGLTHLNNDWYDGNAYQTYSFEYEPGADGYVTWYVGEEATFTLDGRALRANGNIGQRTIPEEPMTVIANFGMSNSFAPLNLTGLATLMPATMRIDYIRIYQDEDNEMVTCDPPGFPTTDYIAKHPEPYANPNMTLWEQTGYEWPSNSYVDGC